MSILTNILIVINNLFLKTCPFDADEDVNCPPLLYKNIDNFIQHLFTAKFLVPKNSHTFNANKEVQETTCSQAIYFTSMEDIHKSI